jgi:hypothetical protein
VRNLCTGQRQLAGTPADGEDPVDTRWRSLWTLRTQLEEVWNVQSRRRKRARAG